MFSLDLGKEWACLLLWK